MRLNQRTEILVNLILFEQGRKTGKKISSADALWEYVKQQSPDLIKQAERLLAKEDKSEKDEE